MRIRRQSLLYLVLIVVSVAALIGILDGILLERFLGLLKIMSSFHRGTKHSGCNEGIWYETYKRYHGQAIGSQNTRYLIYYCDGPRQGCGGFGNRIFGIVSGFYLAVLTRRVFLIHWGGPDRLENYLAPNQINWTYSKHYGLEKMHGSYWGVSGAPAWAHDSRMEGLPLFEKWFETADFDTLLKADVEVIGTIWYSAEKIWESTLLKERAMLLGIPFPNSRIPYFMLSCALRFLFKESAAFKQHLAHARELLNMRPRPHIGIHIRTSDHHFGNSNPRSFRTRNVDKVFRCALRVEEALTSKYKIRSNVTWFLAADNEKVKRNARKKFPGKIVTLPARPGHIEYTRKSSVLRDLLTDMFFLSECDYLIGTYDSTFTVVVQGLRQFTINSLVYGEECLLNNESIQLMTHTNRSSIDQIG